MRAATPTAGLIARLMRLAPQLGIMLLGDQGAPGARSGPRISKTYRPNGARETARRARQFTAGHHNLNHEHGRA